MSSRGKMSWVLVALLGLVACPPCVWAIDQNAQNLQVPMVFRNVSGATTTSGTALVWLFTDSRTTTGASSGATSTIGMDVSTTTVVSSRRFVGVQADDSSLDGTLVRVITQGPALARFACGTLNTYGANGAGDPVGTSSIAGQLGVGTRAGIILSNPVGSGVGAPQQSAGGTSSSDNCLRWVYVSPSQSSP